MSRSREFPAADLDADPAAYARAVVEWSRAQDGEDDDGDLHWVRRGVSVETATARSPHRRGTNFIVPLPFMWIALSFIVVGMSFLGTGWVLAAEKADKRIAVEEFTASREALETKNRELVATQRELGELRAYREQTEKTLKDNEELDALILGDLNRAIENQDELGALIHAHVLATYERHGKIEDRELLPLIHDAVRRMIDELGGPIPDPPAADRADESADGEAPADPATGSSAGPGTS